jgi:hypothetical protein
MTADPAAIIAFTKARLDEDEARVYREGTPPNGVIAWLTYLEADGSMGYTTVAHGDTVDGRWIADGRELAPPANVLVVHDPARVLREVAAKRAILEGYRQSLEILHDNRQTWDLVRAAVGAQRVIVKQLAAVWSDHPDYLKEWAP